jgi:CBS domain-containing protein
MAQNIRDVMYANPITMSSTSTVAEAAQRMREDNIGDVIVVENDQLCGIVTDRDIVVRAIAEGRDPATAKLADICSRDMTTLSPTDTVEDAVRLMRDKAVRRLPVVEEGKPVGIVSLGDLAVTQDPHSTLGNISAASPNV